MASAGNLVKEDNARTAVVIYEEVLSQILSRTLDFQKAGIGKEELISKVSEIEGHLKEDFTDPLGKEQITEELENLQRHIKKAKNIITSVYGQTE